MLFAYIFDHFIIDCYDFLCQVGMKKNAEMEKFTMHNIMLPTFLRDRYLFSSCAYGRRHYAIDIDERSFFHSSGSTYVAISCKWLEFFHTN